MELLIPNTSSVTAWFSFIQDARCVNYANITVVTFNFNNCNFLDTTKLTMLACLIEFIHRTDNIKISYINGTVNLNNHLNNIKFKKYWDQGFNRDAYTPSMNSTTLCLWHISPYMIDTYGRQAQLYYQRQFFQHLDLQPFSATLVEMFNNVFNHSNSIVDGYVLTQYFPNIQKMSFSVCDFGKGIPTSINDYKIKMGEDPYTPDCHAIEQCLLAGISSKSIPQNAGLGLNNILNFSEYTNGTISIYSNKGLYIKKSGQEPYLSTLQIPFDGTLITLKIDTSFFENYDFDEGFYDFN